MRVLVLALAFGAARVGAQVASTTVLDLAGCYTVHREPWSRPFEDSILHKLPTTISLDTATTDRGNRQLRPNIAYPPGIRFPGLPSWFVKGDDIRLTWSNGFTPTVVTLARFADGTLRGRAIASNDVSYPGEPPDPQSVVTLRRTSCPPGFDEATARTTIPVPPRLDSAATEQWVARQQAACGGRLTRMFDEVMILEPRSNTLRYRYTRILQGVQCSRAK